MNKINIWKNPFHLIAFGFGSGLLPFAPGTWGTLAAIPLYLLFAQVSLGFYVSIVLLGLLAGIFICDVTEKAIGVPDYSGIVWDEAVGFWITMFLVPLNWLWILIGFLLFRLFDVWKPFPIRWLDRHLKGGWGIMLDDVLAGVYACIILHGLIFWISSVHLSR